MHIDTLYDIQHKHTENRALLVFVVNGLAGIESGTTVGELANDGGLGPEIV